MANITDYPANWRLQTIGGLPYKFVKMSGRFSPETASIDWVAIFRASDLILAMAELFPGPITVGNITIPQGGVMPGAPGLVAQSATFKSLDTNMPIDPFGVDGGASSRTYHPYIEVTVNFAPSAYQDPDPNDPFTFLEVTGNESYEVIYVPPGDTKLVDEVNSDGENDETPGTGPIDADTGEVSGTVTLGYPRVNQNPNLPCAILVPTTEWNVRWRQIKNTTFRNVISHRLRLIGGRVNSLPLPFLYNAQPETVLYAGQSISNSYSWRDDNVNSSPIDLSMKLIEKRVVWRGITVGHNHVWEPGKGWVRVLIGPDKDEPMYRRTDFNFLFKV